MTSGERIPYGVRLRRAPMLQNTTHRSKLAIIALASLLACDRGRDTKEHSVQPLAPLAAHLIVSDGTPVMGAPEPEAVQLRRLEEREGMKYVTVGNLAGDYVLVCKLAANQDQPLKSCLSPRPRLSRW